MDGLITELPNVTAAVEPTLPREVRSGEYFDGIISPEDNPADDQPLAWIAFDAARGRVMRVSTTRSVDPQTAHARFTRIRHEEANVHFLKKSGLVKGFGIDSGAATKVKGLGEEAFSFSERIRGGSEPEQDNANRRYDIGGAVVCTRFRNVVICATWEGADYPPSAASKSHMKGTPLSYAQGRKTDIKVIKTVLARLS